MNGTAVTELRDEAPVIEAREVDHFYEGQIGWNHALDHLTLSIRRNEFLCILRAAAAKAPFCGSSPA